MEIKLDRIQERIKSALHSPLSNEQIATLAQKVYLIINLADEELMNQIFESKISPIFTEAEIQTRELRSTSEPIGSSRVFDIASLKRLADSLSQDDLERLVILGFFLQDQNYSIIRLYISMAQNLI